MSYTAAIPGVHTRFWLWPNGLSVSNPFIMESIVPGSITDFDVFDVVNRLPADTRSLLLDTAISNKAASICLAYGDDCYPTDIFGSSKLEVLDCVYPLEYSHDSTGTIDHSQSSEDVLERATFEIGEYYQWVKPNLVMMSYEVNPGERILDIAVQTIHPGCYGCEDVCWVIAVLTLVPGPPQDVLRVDFTTDMGLTWQGGGLVNASSGNIAINGDILFITVPDNDIVYYERISRLNRNLLTYQSFSSRGYYIKGKGWNDDKNVYFIGEGGNVYYRTISKVNTDFELYYGLYDRVSSNWETISDGFVFQPGLIADVITGDEYQVPISGNISNVSSNGNRLLISYADSTVGDEVNTNRMEITGTFTLPNNGASITDLGQIVYADDWYSVIGGKSFRKIQPEEPARTVVRSFSTYPGDQIVIAYEDEIIVLNPSGDTECRERQYYEYVAALVPSMEAMLRCDGSGAGLYIRMWNTTDGTHGVEGVGYVYYVTLDGNTTIITGDDESVGIHYISLPSGSDDTYSIVLEISYLDVTWTADPYFITASTDIVDCDGECVECGATHEILYCATI